eukprot:gene480-260_t
MLHGSSLLRGGYMMYHRQAMSTMRYSKWKGSHGGISHFYNRTAMTEEVKRSGMPITLIDRQMMSYVHRTRERHYQLFRSYQQKTSSTECKLREGEMLRRRWHRRLQKSFIAFMQFKTMKVLEEQAQLVHAYGQASVNAALGDPWQNDASCSSQVRLATTLGPSTGPVESTSDDQTAARQRKFAVLRRKVQVLPAVNPVPKHVATMKQIHNDRFNYRWRVN